MIKHIKSCIIILLLSLSIGQKSDLYNISFNEIPKITITKNYYNHSTSNSQIVIDSTLIDIFEFKFICSDKKLINNSINSSNDFKEKKFQYEGELFGLKNEKNILFTKKFGESIFFDKEIFTENKDDIVATTFDLKNKRLILKSYLLNNKKNIDILTYDKLINKENTNEDNPEISIFSDIKNFDKYLKPLINDFELNFFEVYKQNYNKNIFFINYNKDWLIIFEKNK